MSKVKTYAVNCNDAWLNTDGDDVSGSYVKYADYKALATRLDIAERACAAMVAENALIKSAIPEPRDIEVDNDNMDDVSLAEDFGFNHAIELMKRRIPETPATDAFLAEVRSQGVEMYADNLDNGADDAERCGFDDAVKFLRSEASGVRLFAAQIRKGVEQK